MRRTSVCFVPPVARQPAGANTLLAGEAVDVLLAYGADIDGDAGYGYTPLIDACFCLNAEGLAELTDRGADVNVEFYAPPGNVALDAAQLKARGVRPIDICCAARSDRPLLGRLDVLRDEASQTWKRGHSTEWTAYYNKERYRRPVLVSSLIQAGALDRVSEGQPPPLVMAAASQ